VNVLIETTALSIGHPTPDASQGLVAEWYEAIKARKGDRSLTGDHAFRSEASKPVLS
jgi:hypothetical protein